MMISNQSTSNKKTAMVAIVASILVIGMSLSSFSASAFEFNKLKNFDSIGDIGQSADCVGVAIECASFEDSVNNNTNNNNNNGGNGNGGNGNGDYTCEECFEQHLSEQQIIDLLADLQVSTLAEVCVSLDADALVTILLGNGVSVDVILALLACLDLEVPPLLL